MKTNLRLLYARKVFLLSFLRIFYYGGGDVSTCYIMIIIGYCCLAQRGAATVHSVALYSTRPDLLTYQYFLAIKIPMQVYDFIEMYTVYNTSCDTDNYIRYCILITLLHWLTSTEVSKEQFDTILISYNPSFFRT